MGNTARIHKQKNTEEKIKELESMLLTMTRGIVDHPKETVVYPAPGEGFVHFEVRCCNEDAGSLIGTRGAHAEAIRTLIIAAGAVRKIRVSMRILSRDGDNQYSSNYDIR